MILCRWAFMKRFLTMGLGAAMLLRQTSIISSFAADLQVPVDYSNIQSAVDAAHTNDVIHIASGVYTGQVQILSKKLTLLGEPGAILRATPEMSLFPGSGSIPIVAVQSSEVAFRGLTFDGGGLADQLVKPGIGDLNGVFGLRSSIDAEDCAFIGFRERVPGPNRTQAIIAFTRDSTNINVRVVGCTFTDNYESIYLAGAPSKKSMTITLENNTIVGLGPLDTGFHQLGIYIGEGVGGRIAGNTISGMSYVGATSDPLISFGIVASNEANLPAYGTLQPLEIVGNVLRDNQNHIALVKANGTIIRDNHLLGSAAGITPGGVVVSGTGLTISNNEFEEMPEGIRLLGRDPVSGTALGIAVNALVMSNRFCNVTTNVTIQPLASATQEGNEICPFPPLTHGRIERGQIDSPSLKTNLYGDSSVRPYMVYLPPSYDYTTNRYPVVYALHGYGDNETLFIQASEQVPSAIPPFLDTMIASRQLGEVIVVSVCATNRLYGSFYLSSPVIGDYETYIATDLVNWIDTSYRTLPVRESRAIVGYSMGGWGAAHLALKFPNVFSVLVAEAGFYDTQSERVKSLFRNLAGVRPSTFAQFDRLAFPNDATQALLAGLLPNPQRPPLFTDYPYETVAGQLTTNTAAIQALSEGDVQNGDLTRYAAQPFRLTAIKLVHGTKDSVTLASGSMAFTNALATLGFASSYEQHRGGHIFRADLALPFAITNLSGAQIYTEPPRLSVVRSADQVLIRFPTKTGVSYRVESRPTLGTGATPWTGGTSVIGDGQAGSFTAPIDRNNGYFRIRATHE